MAAEPEDVEAKRRAVVAITAHLDAIAAERRDPDRWEMVHLVGALSAAFRGGYRLATVEAINARVPPAERSSSPLPDEPVYRTADLDLLRAALAEVEAEPVRPWPAFGPVAFSRP